MKWVELYPKRWAPTASQIAQIVWLAVTALALSLALSGLPRYVDLLQKPCNGVGCFETQLTLDATKEWVMLGKTLEEYALLQTSALLLINGLVLSAAALLIWRKAHEQFFVFTAFVATALATSTLSRALAHTAPHLLLPAQLILFVQMAGLLPLVCLFPDGRFQPRAIRWVVLIYELACLIYLKPGYPEWLTPETPGYVVWLVFGLISLFVVIASMTYRFRNAASSSQQEQLLWAFAGMGLAALVALVNVPIRLANFSFIPLIWPERYEPIVVTSMFLAVSSFTCLLVALFNYEPPNTDVHLNRMLVYGALTAAIIGAYALGVGAVGALLLVDGNILLSLVTTSLVAIAFNPVRERLQLAASRLLYGERDDPYRVLTRLGQLLEVAIQPAAALPLTVETVANALKLPYVAVMLKDKGGKMKDKIVAVHGNSNLSLNLSISLFPLIYAGETIGELAVAPRTPNEPLDEIDRQVLSDIAKQISVAAHAALLTTELEHARLRIVTAREEARRRLGSDLHDGLGHQLTGLARQAEMATTLLEHNPAEARAMLVEVTQQLNTAISQVRGMAHQLHPPELELLGLVGALRERVQTQNSFAIRMNMPDSLPPLPTAIETAAYYIALEALTNVEKHAKAKWCTIRIALVESHLPILELDVIDDGRGLPPETAHGLGLLSMQARAAEVGGICSIETNPGGGTCVSARLPCSME